MKFELHWLNCLWLLVPLLAWNLVLAPKIALEKVVSDTHSPAWLLTAENIIRIAVFAFPVFLFLQVRDGFGKTGLTIYLAGTLVYFVSWMPLICAPQAVWSQSTPGLLAPRITPFLPFLGIALIGHSLPYAAISILFVTLHTLHGIQNLTS
jgi:hypothetical protein